MSQDLEGFGRFSFYLYEENVGSYTRAPGDDELDTAVNLHEAVVRYARQHNVRPDAIIIQCHMMLSVFNWNTIYYLCNRHQWFTAGSVAQYDRLYNLVRTMSQSQNYSIPALAVAIWICSDDIELQDIEDTLSTVFHDLVK